MADINLLPQEEREHEQFQILQKRLSVASISLLAITAILTLLILVVYTSSVSKRSNLVTQIEASSKRIEDMKAGEELIVVVKEKAQAGDKILSNRTNHSAIFEKLATLIPTGVYFTDVKFTPEKAAISGKASSSANVAGLISSLLSPEGAKIFSSVTMDSLSSDESGVFTFSMTVQLSSSK
ncbi:hypothetical protein A3F45_04190 [Candidatus Curtissbacteria bacterium RIFCSPHIGHO2_12_FULL_41_17]|uniref:PilN domain-containing protein n=2 Tax=Candidatus Curtissiibacteriota TaxID=1752717 RepID=A0A1F5HKU1_9BACT|nr:MAG: hypothetical protein A2693_04460 [Candidatus Curtissbacteria bacterium RIFCSPHIGHO2_01_FULL_40_12]OGE04649.1 MAG: hypothetical protein A3F45_04190 [Candidatus Curtissbacteria bacterium RIFCSPHIGHO2_12_FULL_41_17]